MPHVHVGFMEFLVTMFYVLIGSFLWRAATARLADNRIGQAMSAVL